MIAGFQGRVRIQGHPDVHEPNDRQQPKKLANSDLIQLERPIEHMILNFNRMMTIQTQIAERDEQRRSAFVAAYA